MGRSVSSVLEPHAREYENAVVMPCIACDVHSLENMRGTLGGVYSNGLPVPDALFIDGREQAEHQAPYREPSVTISEKCIYCGPLSFHFGHFILESLPRIWYAKQHPELKIVWTLRKDYLPYQEEILELLGIRNEPVFVDSSTRFPSLIVPSLGYAVEGFIAPHHLDALGVVEPKEVIPGKKLYISRSRSPLNHGDYVNETDMEEILIKQGWKIFYPEEHPVKARFDEISSSEIVLIIDGAAFTSLIFFKALHSKIFCLPRLTESEPYLDVLAKEKSFDYVRLNVPGRVRTDKNPVAAFEIDLKIFKKLLRRTDSLSGNIDHIKHWRVPYRWDHKALRSQFEDTRNAIKTKCTRGEEHFYRSVLLGRDGDLDRAISEIERAIAIRNDNPLMHHHLAEMLIRKGDPDSAEKARNRAMALERAIRNFEFHLHQGHLHALGREWKKAAECIGKARGLRENMPALLHDYFAGFFLLAGDLDGAEAAQRKAVELDPESSIFRIRLDHIHARKSKWKRTIEILFYFGSVRRRLAIFIGESRYRTKLWWWHLMDRLPGF